MNKKNILLVDNGNDGLTDYYELLSEYTLDTVVWNQFSSIKLDKYDLIVLTHGRGISVKKNHIEKELLLHTDVPVIGICYGFQMLAVTYGLEITQLEIPAYGENTINVLTDHVMFNGMNKFISEEKHKYGVVDFKDSSLIKVHGISSYGVEIIEIIGKKQYGFQFHPEIPNINNEGKIIFFNLLNYLLADASQ